jgi:hypothetical protein
MRSHDGSELPERGESLWFVAAAPAVWAVHFLASYVTAAVWCAKFAPPGGSLAPVQKAIGVYTALALAAIGWVGWRGLRRHRRGAPPPPHADDTAGGRHRFLGYAALLLAGLSAVAVVYAQMAALAMGSCD